MPTLTPLREPTEGEKKAAERMRSLPGRAEFAAALTRWSAENPTKPCAHCGGRGFYVERDGERRPFDPATFSAEAGDRYEGSCPACHGGGKIFISREEAEQIRAEEESRLASFIQEERAEYARIRSAVCRQEKRAASWFDRAARRLVADPAKLSDADLARAWVAAARAIGRELGVKA